jgi:3-oxoadipate enol-lactonase
MAEVNPAPVSGFAQVNGTRLYYEIAGSGPPLVLIHGFTLDTRMWEDQFSIFADRYQVLRYDVRGFGKSAVPTTESYSAAADLKALLTYLHIEQAHILGLSMGGGHATRFALAYPESTKTLISVDAVLGGYQWGAAFASDLHAVVRLARTGSIQAAREHWLGLDLFAPARGHLHVNRRLEQMINDYSGWHWLHDDPGQELDPSPAQQLDRIGVPTLVIVGEQDLPDFRQIADLLESYVPDARKVIIKGAGHMANMEEPSEFNDIVLRFLKAH